MKNTRLKLNGVAAVTRNAMRLVSDMSSIVGSGL